MAALFPRNSVHATIADGNRDSCWLDWLVLQHQNRTEIEQKEGAGRNRAIGANIAPITIVHQ